MRFGYFDNLQDPTQERDYSDLIAEMRERALLCEEAGMEIFWLPEHHFSIWGRELLPTPLMMAADLAARTHRIRLGLGAAIIGFWHPLRLAEDLSLLDHLSGGRLEIGVGRGNYGLEASNLNPLADPNKPAMNLKVFLETLGVLKHRPADVVADVEQLVRFGNGFHGGARQGWSSVRRSRGCGGEKVII